MEYPVERRKRTGKFWQWNYRMGDVATRAVDAFYLKPLRKIIPRELFRYAFCGGFTLLLGWVVYYLVFHYVVRGYLDLGFTVMSPHIQALFIQFPITFLCGFWLNKYVAFQYSSLEGKTQLIRYLLTVGVSFFIKYILMKLFVEALHIFPTVATILTDVLNVVCSFVMQKYFTFRSTKARNHTL